MKKTLFLVALLIIATLSGCGGQKSPDLGSKELWAALNLWDGQSIKKLIEKKINVDSRNQQGLTPLIYTAQYCIPGEQMNSIMTDLIKAGADVNAKDPNGHTPLFRAATTGKLEAAQILLDSNANVNMANNDGATPLIRSAESLSMNPEPVISLLIKRGADLNAKDNSGKTALVYAVMRANTTTIKLLLDAGADPNIVLRDGSTVLMEAVQQHRSDPIPILESLVAGGANVRAKNNSGKTALDLAKEINNQKAITFLEKLK